MLDRSLLCLAYHAANAFSFNRGSMLLPTDRRPEEDMCGEARQRRSTREGADGLDQLPGPFPVGQGKTANGPAIAAARILPPGSSPIWGQSCRRYSTRVLLRFAECHGVMCGREGSLGLPVHWRGPGGLGESDYCMSLPPAAGD